MQDDPFLNAVLKKKEEEEDPFLAVVKKATGAPAPVVSSSTPQPESGKIDRFLSGFKQGAKNSLLGMAETVQSLRPQDEETRKAFLLPKKSEAKINKQLGPKTNEDFGTAGSIGEFVGSVAAELPVSIGSFKAVNKAVAPIANKFLSPTAAKVVSKVAPGASAAMREALEVGITTIPQEIISGSIAEAIVRPEAFQDWKSAARIAALSSIGSVFNMGGAYMGAIKKAKTIEELTAIQNQLKELNDEIADVGRFAPVAPEVQAGPVLEGSGRQLPTAQQVASGRALNQELPTAGQLPTHRQAAWARINQRLEEEAEKRLAAFNNLAPAPTPRDPILEASNNPIPDPLVAAQVKGIEERLARQLEVLGGGGKGVITDTRVPLENVSTPSFLTIEELNDHLRVLNMASVGSEPKFKKGQRFIVPRAQLMSAEEIAARATGGPIPAIDKTIQVSFKNIQSRLDDAARRGIQTLDPQETQEVVGELLSMSRRLSRGFEVPYTPRTAPIPEAPSRYVEGLDLPTSAKLDDLDWTSQIDPAHKRWVDGSDAPATSQTIAVSPDVPSVPTTPNKEVVSNYANDVRNMNIDYSPKIKGVGQRMWDKLKDIKTEFYDRTWGVGKYDRGVQNMLSMLSGASAYADEFYETQMRIAVRDADGVYRGATKVVDGIPLGKLVNTLNMDEIIEANALLKAMTLVDEVKRNPKFVMDVELSTAENVIKNAPQKIKDFAAGFKIVSDALVEDGLATGRISAAKADEMRSAFYAGLTRSFNEGTTQNTMKARLGSKRSSLPPIQLMRDNIFKTLEQNRKNAAYGKLASLADANPEQFKDIIQPVDLPSALENVPGYTAMVDELMKDGMLYNEAAQIAALQVPLFDQTNNVMRVFREGKMSLYRVNEDIRKAMEALNPLEFGAFRSLLSAVSAPLRTTTSLALDLSLVGPVADSILTTARTPGFIPIVHSIEGLLHSMLKTDAYLERIAAGGGYGGRFEPSEIVVYKGAKATAIGKVGEKILHPLKWAQGIIRPLSDASRMGEYLVRRRGGETAMQAALASRRTLGDFNRVGASLRGWALVTEFGNVGIQTAGAAYELGQNAIKEARKGNIKPLMRVMSTGVGAITLPTIYFRMAAEGDEELNQYRKSDQGYRYWWTRLPFDTPGIGKEGDVVKYPKPGWWMGQVFGSTVEAALDGMDEEARKRLYDGIWGQVGLNPVPLKAQQVFGLLTNTRNPLSFGDNIPITPPSQSNLDASVQGNERTSPLARALADKAGINPFMTDFIVESAGGTFFGNILRQVGPNPVKLEKTDIPVLGRFAVKKGAPTEGSSQFYRDIEEARKFETSAQKALDVGDVEKVRKLEEENALLIALRPTLEKHVKEIGEVNNLIYSFTMDPNISPEGKREMIDNLRLYQNTLFRAYAEDRKAWIGLKKQ